MQPDDEGICSTAKTLRYDGDAIGLGVMHTVSWLNERDMNCLYRFTGSRDSGILWSLDSLLSPYFFRKFRSAQARISLFCILVASRQTRGMDSHINKYAHAHWHGSHYRQLVQSQYLFPEMMRSSLDSPALRHRKSEVAEFPPPELCPVLDSTISLATLLMTFKIDRRYGYEGE